MSKKMTTLGESCQFFNGKAHEKDIDAEGAFVVVNSKFISRDGRVLKFTGKQMFPLFEDDIVMVMSDVPNGKALAKCYIIEENDKYSLNQRICAIRTTEFDIRFLYYQLNRHPFLLAFNNGENQSNLRKGDILNCPLWKPSLEVQENIVELLDEALEQIEQSKANIKKNIENAQELFQSKLDAVFLQKGNDWEEKKLGELATVEYGYTDKSTTEGDYRYVRITDIDNNGNLIAKDIKYIKYSKEAEKFILKDKDLLMARTGATFAKVLLHNDIEPSIFASYLIRINFQEKIENELYWYFSKSRYYWKQANDLSSGAAQPHFNGAALKQLVFLYPKSMIEQERLINIFEGFSSETQEIEEIYSKKLLNLDELKKAILQKAFAGELTSAGTLSTNKEVVV